jgi:amidase
MASSNVDPAELAGWDAVETRDRIRGKDVTAAEVVEAAIARAEEAGHLGAIVTPLYERARAAVASRGATSGTPFAGVPTFIKDLARVGGARIGWGSRASGECVARASDSLVRHVEGLGMVVLGKSATPELGLTATTEPVGSAPCRNPWDTSRSAGGSSGGAAALVASGVVPIAHGSDGGGSIRIPASCCGLVGFKPSRFRLDMEGSTSLPVNVACDGVLTRSVRDTVAFFEGLEARGAGSRRLPPVAPVGERPTCKLRVGLFVDAPTGTPVDSEVQGAVRDAGALCRALGHEVEAIACPFEGSLIDDFLRYWGFVAWIQAALGRALMTWRFDRRKLEPWTTGLARHFADDKRAGWRSIRRLRAFRRTFARVMKRYDVLLSPTLAEPAPAIGHLATDLAFDTMFTRVRAYAPFTPLYNAAGAPAIALPLGRTEAGLPIGVQLAMSHGDDRTLLALARSLEAAKPWPRVAVRAPSPPDRRTT